MEYEIDAVCPWCGYETDRAAPAGPNEIGPEEGSLGVCLRCVGVCVYEFTGEAGARVLSSRLPTPEEEAAIKADSVALDLILGVKRAIVDATIRRDIL